MGTFLGDYGGTGIPENKLEECTRRMLKILDAGGMMDIEAVSLYGRRLVLLRRPEVDMDSTSVCFCYNYFENDCWETAGYHPENGCFVTNKVGTRQFNLVSRAVYVLLEFYDASFRISEEDGHVYDAQNILGWLNYLFDEAYTNARVLDLWKIYRLLPDYRRSDDLLRLLPLSRLESVSHRGLLKYLAVARPDLFERFVGEAENEQPDAGGTLPLSLFLSALKNSIQEIAELDGQSADEKLSLLKDILTGKITVQDLDGQEPYQTFSLLSAGMAPEFSVKYIADRFQLDFWELWAELEPLIPCRPETPENLTPLEPIAKLSTSAFLRCSDDDRAWWWRPDGDVQFSEEMYRWLGQLKAELGGLISNEVPNPKAFPRFLVETLAGIEKAFPNVVPFQEMFYDFLAHTDDPGTWVAVRLLGNLKERYLTAQDTDGAQKLRRYLAVLGNLELRKEIFGF